MQPGSSRSGGDLAMQLTAAELRVWETAGVPFVADDLGAWLIGVLADAGRRKLTTFVLGTDQQRALRSAGTAAVRRTAEELCPDDAEQAEHVALVISQVFSEPGPAAPLAGQATVLAGLQTGIAGQLVVLDDASLTGTDQSSAAVLGVDTTELAETLTAHLLREIVVRGSGGGSLFPLASQLNDDVTHLQGEQVKGMLGEVLEVLARFDGTRAAAAAPTAMAQLPPEVAGFTGREDELAVLSGLLDPSGSAGPVLVSAVAGLAGVGKTTLAVQAGHAAQERGWCRGGVLFLDLHGYDEAPVEPGQALDALLRALGVPAEHIPPGVEERAGLYRSVLAEIAGPVLVIADNASSEAQVRPLLPGTGRHRVLVTSRHTLAGLTARLVDITVLDQAKSVELLDTALRAARPEDDRIARDQQAAERLAGACGGLPLALQITAALLKADPALTAAELADELAAEWDRLERLAYDEGSTAAGWSVAAAFELSYRRLEEAAARVFRLLPVNPGPDISTAVAAALTDLPFRQARKVLADLARGHLAEPAPGNDRWHMHDLMRLYAQRLSDEHADADGREQARDRLLIYYSRRAGAAADHLRALPAIAVPGGFSGRDSALAWLDAERANLVAAVSMAADTGRDQVAVRLPLALHGYLVWRRRFDDSLNTLAISLGVARRLGERHSEGTALVNLGIALREVRRFEEAITAGEGAAAIFRETGDRHGEGRALDSLGSALEQVHRFEEATKAHQHAISIFREIGDRHDESIALLNLGNALQHTQQFTNAISAYQDAAAIFRETGDRRSEGMAVNNVGTALRGMRRFKEAIAAHQHAAAMFRETGDRHTEGTALGNLGNALGQMHRFKEAITAYQGAVAIFRETGDRHGEGMALDNLGISLREMRRFEEAITAYQGAAAIFRETGDRHREGTALDNLGISLREMRRFEEAITAYQGAAAIFRGTGDRHREGTALRTMGMTLLWESRFEEAITAYQGAAAIFRETGDEHGEGGALNSLGMALLAASRPEDAVTAFKDAAAIFREMSDLQGEGIALCSIGPALLGAGRFEDAIGICQDAAARLQETGNRLGQAIVLNDLGRALFEAGRFEEAITAHQHAAAIFGEIGDRHSEGDALKNLRRARSAESA